MAERLSDGNAALALLANALATVGGLYVLIEGASRIAAGKAPSSSCMAAAIAMRLIRRA